MELSKRLQAVVSMVTPGNVVCDVGCDHGYVSIFLIETKISPKVYAMDVRQGPLLRAREHVEEAGFSEYIQLLLSDGIKELPDSAADTLICAGMGGRLIIKILSDSLEKVRHMQELILQPQSEIWLVRAFLREQGLVICDEDMVKEDGKFYPVLYVKAFGQVWKEKGNFTSVEAETETKHEDSLLTDKYGELLLQKKHPVLKEYLLWEEKLLLQIKRELMQFGSESEKTKERLHSLENELEQIKEAFAYFDKPI